MITRDDPLVTLWRTQTRPLNWRIWQSLSDVAQARLRWQLMVELRLFTRDDLGLIPAFWREHAHRELLELKAACGQGRAIPSNDRHEKENDHG
jgi:hypothetical protein